MKTKKLWNGLLILAAIGMLCAVVFRHLAVAAGVTNQSVNILRDMAFLVFCGSFMARSRCPDAEKKSEHIWPYFALIVLAFFNLSATFFGF